MHTPLAQDDLNAQIQERFKELPPVVQNAVTSADIQKHLRELADVEKLHVDQWQLLENNVMLTLLGFQEVTTLPENLQEDLGITVEQARKLTEEISRIVFEPVRQELERNLEHPEAHQKEKTDVAEARSRLLESSAARNVPNPASMPEPIAAPAPIAAATPPAAAPVQKVVRAPASGAYKPGEASTARKDVRDDPYREAPV
jgi:hypothetical protein